MFFTMNKKEQYEEDLLRKFINPERIEKAPEGFTSKTLARIQIEAQSTGLKKGFFLKNRLPLISAAITAGFIIIAILIPSGNRRFSRFSSMAIHPEYRDYSAPDK